MSRPGQDLRKRERNGLRMVPVRMLQSQHPKCENITESSYM